MFTYIASHPGFDFSMALLGVLCYVIFSVYMWERHRRHMMENIPMGVLLLLAAIAFGPLIAFAYFLYALWVGTTSELDYRFLGKVRLVRNHSSI